MAVTIMEALQNAKINITGDSPAPIQLRLGRMQLYNAVTLLEKGYGLHDEVEPLLDEYGNADSVPDNTINLED